MVVWVHFKRVVDLLATTLDSLSQFHKDQFIASFLVIIEFGVGIECKFQC
jgi:hypothetical protein